MERLRGLIARRDGFILEALGNAVYDNVMHASEGGIDGEI